MHRVSSSASESRAKVGSVGDNAAEPAGKAALPSAPLSLLARLSRRDFLILTGMLAFAALPGCDSRCSAPTSGAAPSRSAYRLSGRGRRISNAAKKHNANKLFATAEAAEGHRAHPGDTSRVVSIDVSDAFYRQLFADGDIADLRRVFR